MTAPWCRECKPGVRVGDDGCGHGVSEAEALAEVLAAHSVEDYSEGEYDGDASLLCCCEFVARGSDLYDAGINHRAHVAQHLAASPALDALRARERAGALEPIRELADRWDEGVDTMLPFVAQTTNAPNLDGRMAMWMSVTTELRRALARADQQGRP